MKKLILMLLSLILAIKPVNDIEKDDMARQRAFFISSFYEMKMVNLYFFGDSIIAGYTNKDRGPAYYIGDYSSEDIEYRVIADYSEAGATVCGDMRSQVDEIKKKLQNHRGEQNIVICDGGTNDILYECNENHVQIMQGYIDELREVDQDVNVLFLIPDYVGLKYTECNEVYADMREELDCFTYKLGEWIPYEDVQKDYIHIKEDGYKRMTEILNNYIRLFLLLE